ncbi:MAG: hypothetical protein EPN93_15685 [Spirochaetes bacterium]|nr:MAG: hypothetical protein EPN93_15685 [Spirochaetota bacterium]
MKHPAALLIPAILCAILASCSRAQYKYVTADSLVCRQEPRVGAPVVNVLPYGTRVSITRADREDSIGNRRGTWYWSADIGGYLFGAFLADAPPPAGKFSMTLVLGGTGFEVLKELYCALPAMGGGDTAEKLTLADNKAVMERIARFEGGTAKTIETGTYEATGAKIEIRFTHRERTPGGLSIPGLKAPAVAREEIQTPMTLHYSDKAAGFLSREALDTLTDASWRLDYNSCTVVKKLQDKCDAATIKSVEKGALPYTDEKNLKSVIKGYFCNRLK